MFYECFRWCLVRYWNPVDINPAIIKTTGREFWKQLNFKGMKFPVQRKGYAKTEKQNKIRISVFDYKDKN